MGIKSFEEYVYKNFIYWAENQKIIIIIIHFQCTFQCTYAVYTNCNAKRKLNAMFVKKNKKTTESVQLYFFINCFKMMRFLLRIKWFDYYLMWSKLCSKWRK